MPELPEVENVRLALARHVPGRRVVAVRVHRPEVIEGERSPAGLLVGMRIVAILRHGKNLALVAGGGPRSKLAPEASVEALRGLPCVGVHLGMTGSLCYLGSDEEPADARHVHVEWLLSGVKGDGSESRGKDGPPPGLPPPRKRGGEESGGGRIIFRDPRRFGGVWTYVSLGQLLDERWALLGPDALAITAQQLHDELRPTRRPIKAALMDQTLIAGMGNIYADELLFRCGIHPQTPAGRLKLETVQEMVQRMRELLATAIGAGGTTVSDFVDGRGKRGRFQLVLQVYGRTGEVCLHCATPLRTIQAAGRTTVFCPACQRQKRRKTPTLGGGVPAR